MQDFVWYYSLLNWLLPLLQNVLMKFCERTTENTSGLINADMFSVWKYHLKSCIEVRTKRNPPLLIFTLSLNDWGWKRPLDVTWSNPLQRQGHLQPVTWGHVWMALDDPQGWRFHHLPEGTSASASSLSQWKNIAQYLEGTSCVLYHVHWLWSPGKRAWLHSLYNVSGIHMHS